MATPRRRRSFLAPEVLGSSSMDCGIAALQSVLQGHGIRVSYGRLREVCQTDVDGTSIDTLEEVSRQLGLDADQLLIPADFFLIPECKMLPAIVVVKQKLGLHFVVIWRRHGRLVQVMDGAIGRRWVTVDALIHEIYQHEITIPAGAWREYAEGEQFTSGLQRKLVDLGVANPRAMIAAALQDPSWHAIAELDAAARMVSSIHQGGAVAPGRAATALLESTRRVLASGSDRGAARAYWSARAQGVGDDGDEQLLVRGAVAIRIQGLRDPAAAREHDAPAALSDEVATLLKEPPIRPARELVSALREDGVLTPLALFGAILLATGGTLLETVLIRGLFDLGRRLGLVGQRLAAGSALLFFIAAMLALELPIAQTVQRMGRALEIRIRARFLEKIPRLGDRYVRSRPMSDMAERSHSLYALRSVTSLGTGLLRASSELLVVAAGIAWIDPVSLPRVALLAAASIFSPFVLQPLLTERDLRMRTQSAALVRFNLDALLGLVPLQTHGAAKLISRSHDDLLATWAEAALARQRVTVWERAIQATLVAVLTAWIVLDQVRRAGDARSLILLLYWALALPALGERIASQIRQYPVLRNLTMRIVEPLGAPEEFSEQVDKAAQAAAPPLAPLPEATTETSVVRTGVRVDFDAVSVHVAGHQILRDATLTIAPGSHVAVVGQSGAGKSTLVGLLLGWHKPSSGTLRVDGAMLDAGSLAALRRATAWVDPTVQLWNRSLLDNLQYGAQQDAPIDLAERLEQADLLNVLERMPHGLQTELGENGALVSGGEGQRVRFGRALQRADARLVVLDEPFRGLDRRTRGELLIKARKAWRGATLICITHDISFAKGFRRVLVIEDGRIVEDGVPAELAAQNRSRFRALLSAEATLLRDSWSSDTWRKLRMENGLLIQQDTQGS